MKTMMNLVKTTAALRRLILVIGLIVVSATFGCRTKSSSQKQNKEFFTSGSREADQRASQRMAREEQLAGSGEGAGEKKVKKATKSEGPDGSSTNKAAQAEGKLALFDRLGGEKGITAIVEDATPRILQDPRVNFSRIGVKSTGFSLRREKSVTWQATPENIAKLKKYLVQFIALASGGPAHYEGRDMKSVHANMHISNPEFDAAVGDLKASLDKLQIPNTEQKELLAIIESTRPEIVTVR